MLYLYSTELFETFQNDLIRCLMTGKGLIRRKTKQPTYQPTNLPTNQNRLSNDSTESTQE